MKTASQLRIDLANSQRTLKGREKWLEMAYQINKKECWHEKTSHEDAKIGDMVAFNKVSPVSGGYRISRREGRAFAFGVHSMLIIYRGKIENISLGKARGES